MPVFARGTGLGNRLFNWGRAHVYARKHGLEFISPIWFSPRMRQIFDGGSIRDTNLGLFKRGADEHALYTGLYLKLFGEIIPEPIQLEREPGLSKDGHSVILFSGVGGEYHNFQSIACDGSFLKSRLESITRGKWKKIISTHDAYASSAIGVHMRYGRGFNEAKSKDDFYIKGALRTPINWFATTIKLIRHELGKDVPVLLVTDGKLDQIEQILSLGNVRLVRPACPVSDLLILSSTRVLIGSGGSSFSAWASYLGGMPTVVHPGQCLSWFGLPTFPNGHVGTFDPDEPDAMFLHTAKVAFT